MLDIYLKVKLIQQILYYVILAIVLIVTWINIEITNDGGKNLQKT